MVVHCHLTELSNAVQRTLQITKKVAQKLVSLAAVFWAVTQRSPQKKLLLGGALRDCPKNGCEGDYSKVGQKKSYRCSKVAPKS